MDERILLLPEFSNTNWKKDNPIRGLNIAPTVSHTLLLHNANKPLNELLDMLHGHNQVNQTLSNHLQFCMPEPEVNGNQPGVDKHFNFPDMIIDVEKKFRHFLHNRALTSTLTYCGKFQFDGESKV